MNDTVEHIVSFRLITEEERKQSRLKLINEIENCRDGLARLQVYTHRPVYSEMDDLTLCDEVESWKDWLKRRQKFVSENPEVLKGK